MIINTDKDDVTEQSAWNKFEAKVRMHLYVLMHELTVNQVFTVLLYKILLVIEAAQFIWYAFHPRLTFLWDNGTMDVLRKVFKFSQVDQFLIDDGSSVLIPLLYIFCAFLVIMLVIAIVNINMLASNSQHRSSSSFLNYSLKILNAYNFLLTTILAFPFYFTFISVFACTSENPVTNGLECYTGIFYLHWIVAFLSCIILFISSLALTFLSVDLNPWSKSPFASPKSRINLLKLAFKVIVSIYFVLDYNGNAKKVFVVIYCVLWLLVLILRFRQTPLYNRSIFNFTIGLETIIFWISLISVFEAFIDTTPAENIGLLYLALGIIPLVFAVIKLFQWRRESLYKTSPKTLKRDIDVELYILNIIELLDFRDDVEQRMTLEGLLKLHIKTCSRPEAECPCRAIAGNYYKDEAPEMLWYNWLKLQLIDGSNKFPKSARLHLLHAYMANFKLKNKYMALLQLIAAQKCKPSTEEQFTIYRCKKIIEQDMMDLDTMNSETKVNVNVIVEFQSRLIKFETAVEESVDLYQEFWSEVSELSPEIHKLNSLGSKITSSVKIVALQYKKLEELNANQVKLLTMYGFYLKDIVNDDFQGDKILEKAVQVAKNNKLEEQFLTKEQVKYGENSDTCLITVSGNPQTMGKMIRINNEITRLLKFTKQELTGRNVSQILPRGLAEIHDKFMNNYVQTSEEKTINKEMLTFPVNKAGYIVPCSLMVKVLPNLNAGIRFIGFLRELDEEREDEEDIDESGMQTRGFKTNTEEFERYYIMYDGRTGTIYGITYGCKLTFGIPMSLINGEGGSGGGNNFNIDTIFPGLMQCSEQELKRPEGINVVLDTSTLRQNFFFAEDDDEDLDDEVYRKSQNLKDLKFRQVDVNVRVVQDDKYPELHIRTIKFNEARYSDAQQQEGVTKVVKSQKRKAFKHNRTTSTKNEGGVEVAAGTPGRMSVTAGEGQEEEVEGEAEEVNEKSAIENQQSSAFSSSQLEGNEEMKLIKDFKTFISANKTPRLIIILRNSMLLLGVVLLALITADLVLRLQQMGEYTDGISYLSQDYQRHSLMGELNYNLRKLDLMAQDYLDIATADQAAAQANFKTKVISAVNQLNEITLSINSQQDTLEDRGFTGVESDKVTVESLLQSGTKTDKRYFSDSMAQYTSHATSAANSPLADFISTDTKISTKADFYYVRRNGLGSLRVKSESNAEAFSDFYYDDVGNFDKKFLAIMLVAIIITMISLSLLMSVVNSVHKTSTTVLSLFMYLPLSEINVLESHCHNFKVKYLLDRKVLLNYSFSEEGIGSKKPSRLDKLKNGYHALNGDPMITEEISQDMKASAIVGGDQDMQSSQASKSFSATQDLALSALKYKNMLLKKKTDPESVTGRFDTQTGRFDTVTGRFDTTARFLKTEGDLMGDSPVKKIGEELHEETMMKDEGHKVIELNEDMIQMRSEKFRQSRDEYRLRVFLEFLFVGLIFIGYFVGDYVDNRTKLNKLKVNLNHLKLLAERNANVRFIQTFTLEVLAEGNDVDVNYYSYLLPYKDLRQHYITETLSNMKDLSTSRRESYTGAFSSYFSLYDSYTNGDLCSSYYKSDTSCEDIADGLLKQGLTIAITGIEQKSQSIVLAFNASAKAEQDQKDAINGDEFEKAENLLDYTLPVMESLRDRFISSFGDFIDNTIVMSRVKYGIFLAILLLVFFLMWLPYKAALMEKIFKTKGMLKMIPIELITKDENLKSIFFGGNILKAVK